MLYLYEQSKHFVYLYPQTKITLQVVYNEGVKIVILLESIYLYIGFQVEFKLLFIQTQTERSFKLTYISIWIIFSSLNKQTQNTVAFQHAALFLVRTLSSWFFFYILKEDLLIYLPFTILFGYHVVVTINSKVQLCLHSVSFVPRNVQ